MSAFHPSKRRGAFDFEAWRWVNPRCCGLLWDASDGEHVKRRWELVLDAGSKAPETVAPRVLEVMRRAAEEDGVFDWWAHNGGRYDDAFILDAVVRLGWGATGHVAAGRLVVLYLEAPGLKRRIRLYDSAAVVPAPLKDAARDFGLTSQKLLGVDDYTKDVRTWSVPRLTAGCRADCECVLELLSKVEGMLEERGGGLRATFSSATLAVLESKVRVPDTRQWRGENADAREAFTGGRVEVLRHDPQEPLCKLDVTSSYPWAMTNWLPFGKLLGRVGARGAQRLLDAPGKVEGIVHAEVTVPDTYLPALPFVPPDKGVYFPTGTWRASFTACELRYAAELGYAVRPLWAIGWRAERPFARFVGDLFKLKSTGKGAVRQFAKLLLNGCYGKFGQAPERENLWVGSEEEGLAMISEKPPGSVRVLREASAEDHRFLTVTLERWARQTHFALAAYVTALGRVRLHRALLRAVRPAYCDTDSIHGAVASLATLKDELGDGLGSLKVEAALAWGRYFAPKLYRTVDAAGAVSIASKGFPVGEAAFRRVVRGDLVVKSGMRLAKTQLREGGLVPDRRDRRQRRWSGRSMKRRPFADGETVPWTVGELRAGLHLEARSPLARER